MFVSSGEPIVVFSQQPQQPITLPHTDPTMLSSLEG